MKVCLVMLHIFGSVHFLIGLTAMTSGAGSAVPRTQSFAAQMNTKPSAMMFSCKLGPGIRPHVGFVALAHFAVSVSVSQVGACLLLCIDCVGLAVVHGACNSSCPSQL